jgi:hypothetical protein
LSIKSRLRKAVVGVCAVAVLGTVASSALASPYDVPANDPNTTNVPYLAWRGENIRLVKCWGTNDFNRAVRAQGFATTDVITDDNMPALFGQLVQTNVQLEDWSGADTGVNTPKEVINGARTFISWDARAGHPVICWQDTWASNKAGLGQFKLTVSFGINNILNTGVGVGAQVLIMQHQWLAGWMGLNAPTLEEVQSRDHATGSTTQNPEQLGDASGDGVFFAGDGWYQDKTGKWVFDPKNDHPGQLRAVVTGNLPLLQNYSELGLGTSITLPNQWADLANALATDASPTDPNPAMRWDIHDEITNMFGETINPTTNALTGVAGRSHPLTDAVDNAIETNLAFINNTGNARFYRAAVIGGTPTLPPSDSPTAGPFDPNYAEQTLLPDGKLDAGDAPMPATRIDFTIQPNSGGTAIDGVGSFGNVSKALVYSRDDSGTNAKDHNLFAPFYSQWIPATARNDFGYASGVDGALITNNFNGFLVNSSFYHNWTNYNLLSAPGGDSRCYATVPSGLEPGSPGVFRTNPSGPQTVAVYTDEHGEARTAFLPGGRTGNDFYFSNLGSTNSNNGCNLTKRILGTAHITAIARYPYQKVTDPDKTAKTTVDKTVLNLFDKHLSYYQKCLGDDSDCKDIKVVVAHAQDINGQPYQRELVCFTGSINGAAITGEFPQAIGWFAVQKSDGTTFPVYFSGEVFPNPAQPGFRCTRTDDNGNAVFEVLESEALTANVIAKFVPEGVTRDINVKLGNITTFQDNPPLTPEIVLANGGSTVGAGSNGGNEPSQDQIDNTVKVAIAGGFGVIATPAVAPAAPKTITPAKTITVTKTAVKVKMLTLRLVRPLHGKAYFLVKVQSPKKTAKITISLKNKHGKILSKVTKTVKTNTLLKLKSSHITAAVKKIGLVLVK